MSPTENKQLVWVKVDGDQQDIQEVGELLDEALPEKYHGVVSDESLELVDARELMDSLERMIADV